MLKRENLVRLVGVIGMLMLPALASAAGDICYLRDASAPSASTAYLLCEQGMVYVTTDSGAHWTMQRTGADQTLHAIRFIDDTHGVVVGDGGTIMTTANGGKTWLQSLDDKKAHFTTEHLLTVHGVGNQLWAGGFDGALLHSADGGRTWEKQKSGTTMAVQGVYFLDENHGWAVGWSATILRTADGGKTWENVSSDKATWSLDAVYFRDANNGWAVGFAGELLHSSDGGKNWDVQQSPVRSELSSITSDKSGRVWIAADEQLLVSEDGGQKWSVAKVDNNLFLCKVFGRGDSLLALGELGLLQQKGATTEWQKDKALVPAGTSIADSLEAAATSASPSPAAGATPTSK